MHHTYSECDPEWWSTATIFEDAITAKCHPNVVRYVRPPECRAVGMALPITSWSGSLYLVSIIVANSPDMKNGYYVDLI